MLDLSGAWSLSTVDGGYRCTFSLPGDGITALQAADLIPDPYQGRNEYDLRWISETDWIVERTFELDHPDVDLVMSQLDTVATVKVNGQVVLAVENAFRTYRVDLRKVAHVGTNEISITFHSPVEAGRAKYEAHPFPIPWSDNCPIPYGNFLRKPACDFGWDWNIALAPFGLYGDIRCEPQGTPRIDSVLVDQHHHEDGRVDVTLRLSTSHADGLDLSASLAGRTAEGVVVDGRMRLDLTLDRPALWWPAGQGDQVLHDLALTLGEETVRRRIGLRRMELVTEEDAAGLGFKFRVNGRDIFCKGANWIPADALPGRITEDKTRALLQSAVDANMNMIRVWGGGRYEPDSFYETCDELGLMVWQDFMFACNLYPSDPAFLTEVRAEVQEAVARIQHHACLALWCGDNELVGALTWYDVSRADRDRYLVNYDRLNRTVEETLLATDPKANWWPSSPSTGPLSFGDAWHDDSSGDMHFWSVWHEGRDFEHYRDVSPRFCSEFGFQSYPSLDQVRGFADPQDRNIASPVMESHQKNAGGNARIAETIFRYFRFPRDFENFVYVTQVQQALAIKTAVTHWRGLKPHCMGTLIWQLNDTWPVASWSSLDYGGGWKLMHHAARNFYAPVTVVAVPGKSGITLRGVNDQAAPVEVLLTARAADMSGKTRVLGQVEGTLAEDATDLLQVSDLGEREILLFDWQTEDGTTGADHFAPQAYKTYALCDPNLTVSIRENGALWQIDVAAEALALFVAAEADVPGRFDRNGVTLLPAAPTTFTFTPDDPDATPAFILRDLYGATT